ncbi:hypothetical protein GDO81_028006 [Engystomops pustulosus]|uniref:Uncharacterized protein n=1 Tax=Engystomops pustulosus TaxID=76066 RepID=A0AAV6YNT7_ENGPU|nr:hypothetical protein GDO81_028006 [Engystomops pustulosus]
MCVNKVRACIPGLSEEHDTPSPPDYVRPPTSYVSPGYMYPDIHHIRHRGYPKTGKLGAVVAAILLAFLVRHQYTPTFSLMTNNVFACSVPRESWVTTPSSH